MSSQTLEPLSEEVQNHAKFFILFVLSYFTSSFLIMIVNGNYPTLFSPLVTLFGNFALPLLVATTAIVFGRLITLGFAELATTDMTKPYVAVIASLIVSHPIFVSAGGSTITIRWLIIDIIENEELFQFIVEMFIFGFVGIALALIQSRTEVKSSRVSQYIKYVGNEIVIIVISIAVVTFLIHSFFVQAFESVTLSNPIKYLLIAMFYLITRPLPGDKSQEKDMLIKSDEPDQTSE